MTPYLIRQKLCGWLGHRFEPTGTGSYGVLSTIDEKCRRCGQYVSHLTAKESV